LDYNFDILFSRSLAKAAARVTYQSASFVRPHADDRRGETALPKAPERRSTGRSGPPERRV